MKIPKCVDVNEKVSIERNGNNAWNKKKKNKNKKE